MRLRLQSVCLGGFLLIAALPAWGLTVTGKVFVDKNSDGVKQSSEAALSQVAVSDGREVVLTDNSGSYKLETETGRFVYVSLPRGYKAAKGFYRIVEEGKSADFPMALWPETSKDPVRFVQITDLHITDEDSVKVFVKDMAGIGAMDPKPAFVVATGDLVNTGKNVPEFENLTKALSTVHTPMILVPGNHDTGGEGRANYRRFCGPEYYSFNAGSCHFVVMDSTKFDDEQKAWLKKDLAAAPEDACRIVFEHFLPTHEDLSMFSELNLTAVLSGHWHGSRVVRTFGVLNLNTPSFRFAGIDRTPASFRVVDVKNSRVTSELRLTGQEKRLTIVTPAGKVSAPGGELNVLVNAQDTWAEITRVDCVLDGRIYPLTKKGPWSWVGKIPVGSINPGTQSITAVAYSSRGKSWSKSSKFRIDGKTAAVKTGADWAQWHGSCLHQGITAEALQPPLKLAWSASTGGMIGLSSPMVSNGAVAVGVADLGDLEDCGVTAFDAKDGALRWCFRTDSAIKGSLAIADGQVFAFSVSGYLYALDVNTGKLLWKKGLLRHIERWEVTTPAVADGVVYVGRPVYVSAFEVKTGKQLWERSIVHSVDSKTGTKLWPGGPLGSNDWLPSNYSVPTPVGDKLLIATRGGLFALDRATGEPVWKVEGNTRAGAVVDGILYTIKDMVPAAIKVDSGEVLWVSKERAGDSNSTPALSEDKLVVGTADGRVCAYSTKDGTLLWSYRTGKAVADIVQYTRGKSDVSSSPVISGNTVYVGSSDGCLYALSLATGEKLWSYSLGVPIASSPAISGNALFITGYDGNVYAFTGRDK